MLLLKVVLNTHNIIVIGEQKRQIKKYIIAVLRKTAKWKDAHYSG